MKESTLSIKESANDTRSTPNTTGDGVGSSDCSDLNKSLFDVQIDLSDEKVQKKIHEPWPNGLDANKHSMALLHYIKKQFGNPPVHISANNIPHNAYTFKYWRSLVSPQIPDTAFVLYFLSANEMNEYISRNTFTELESREIEIKEHNTSSLSGMLSGFDELTDRFHGLVENRETSRFSVDGPFLAVEIKDVLSNESVEHILTYSLNDFFHHHEARMHLVDLIDASNDSTGRELDLYLTATGYVFLDCYMNEESHLVVEEVTIKEPGSKNPVRASFPTQAKLVLDFLLKHDVPVLSDTKISVQPYSGSDSSEFISTTGATYSKDLKD